MGHAIAFDTLAYTKKLKAAGVPEKQAEVQAEALAEIVDERLATKQGLKELELCLKQGLKELELRLSQEINKIATELKALEMRLKQDLKELETRMTMRLGSIMAGGIVIVATLVKLL